VFELTKGDPERYRREAAALLSEDIEACRAVADHFEQLKKTHDLAQQSTYADEYRKKASELEKYMGLAR
jgi:hypothetical protein